MTSETAQTAASATRRGTVELTLAMVLSGTLGIFVVESGASPFEVVFFRCLFGALALGAYCLARGYFTDHAFTPRKLALAALGDAFVYPAVAMVADWAVYGHHIGIVQALGIPLILLASLRINRTRQRRTVARSATTPAPPATPAPAPTAPSRR